MRFAIILGMHQFPHSSRLQFFVGNELQHVNLGPWQFHFRFDETSICIEGTLEHVDPHGTVHRHNTDEDRLSALYVHHLIGQKISAVSAEEFCLTLTFERGDLLRIFSEEGQYEDGQIYDEAGEVIVF